MFSKFGGCSLARRCSVNFFNLSYIILSVKFGWLDGRLDTVHRKKITDKFMEN